MAAPVSPQMAMSAVLEDGRRISWAEYGSATGAPLVLLHGTPGSRLQFRLFHEAAAAAGVRLVAPERPGSGRSDPVPGGVTYAGYADDLRQLLDHLELGSVTLSGASGGAGFALAAAILHPERVRRLLLVSAGSLPAPPEALKRLIPPVRILLALATHAPRLTGKLLASQVSHLDSAAARWGRRFMPAADRRVFEEPTHLAAFAEDFREALRQGPGAAVQDLRLGRAGLDLDLSNLDVDTVLLHGVDDVNAPIEIARWFAAQVPSSRLMETPGAGHLFTLERPELIFDEVVR